MNSVLKKIGVCVLFGSYVLTLLLFAYSTFNGVTTGDYSVTIKTNILYEHWFEMILLIAGFPGVYVLFKQAFSGKNTLVNENE